MFALHWQPQSKQPVIHGLALMLNLTWPGVIHKVILVHVDEVSDLRLHLSLSSGGLSSAYVTAVSIQALRCPRRALQESNEGVRERKRDREREHCGWTLWMPSCSLGNYHNHSVKLTHGSSYRILTCLACAWHAGAPLRVFCLFFTHSHKADLQSASVCQHHASGNSFYYRCIQDWFHKQRWKPGQE